MIIVMSLTLLEHLKSGSNLVTVYYFELSQNMLGNKQTNHGTTDYRRPKFINRLYTNDTSSRINGVSSLLPAFSEDELGHVHVSRQQLDFVLPSTELYCTAMREI